MKRVIFVILISLVLLGGCTSDNGGSGTESIGYFHSSSQLGDWLDSHKDLQTGEQSSINEDYELARELQQRALEDGYIINIYINDDGEGAYWVWCDAYLDIGEIYYWSMLDFDDIEWYGSW